jgi:hypothetical protein
MVGGAFAGVLIPLRLAIGTSKITTTTSSHKSVAGSDVEELLGGPWALTSQLMYQGLAGGPRLESPNDVDIGDIGQLIALPGEAPDVLMESLSNFCW